MAYLRCDCHTGDVPHPDGATHKKVHSRCTRAATCSVRRVRDTRGRVCRGSWYHYCPDCAKAIRAYQGSDVEIVDRIVVTPFVHAAPDEASTDEIDKLAPLDPRD